MEEAARTLVREPFPAEGFPYKNNPIWRFRSEVTQIQETITRVKPIFYEIEKLNKDSDPRREENEMFIHQLKEAEEVVRECEHVKWNFAKRFRYSLKLKELNASLLRFYEIHVMLQLHVQKLMEKRMLSSVPSLKGVVIGFDSRVRALKAMVLKDPVNDDCSVIHVSAAGGCGKTTLVTMLCHDPDIKDMFGENIFYVTVSETPNFMVIVNDLLNSRGQQVLFQSNEDAKDKLKNFLCQKASTSPILVVLDDVSSDSVIKSFEFAIRGYKILFTSRSVFRKYPMYQLDPLSDKDANSLFHRLARPSPTIDKDLVNQIVKCCKKHPLTLSAVGSSLNGKHESVWKSVWKALSEGLVSNKDVRYRVEKTVEELDEEFKQYFLDFESLAEELKQCLLDFAIFPGDQRIPACALLDMWVHLYDHDDTGRDTLTKILELSYRDLVKSITIGKDANAIVNYCEQTLITQKDMLRELAIRLSCDEPIAQRKRLIIDAPGKRLPTSITKVQEPLQARILSISTGESFSSRWCNMKVHEVEVLLLNLKSETYALPPFLKKMQKLKILNVTSYGLRPTVFENFHFFGSLSNLTRIRLEHVAISSLSRSTFTLENLEKVSFIMCKIGNALRELNSYYNLNVWRNLVEIEIDDCQDLVEFPAVLCTSVHLKKLSITNCNKMCRISEELGKWVSLETLSLRSCTKLKELPESITKLEKLSILDISDCLSLSKLPEQIGKLGGLRMIYMRGCTGVHELPPSVKDLINTQVICSEEISDKWREFPNVKIPVVEEDRLLTISKYITNSPV